MQFQRKQPPGVIYITTMSRPDAALALAMLYGFQGKRESRMGSVCVCGAGLGAAIFCDVLYRFYSLGALRNANDVLPTGLAADGPLPADPPMIKAVTERRNDQNEWQYTRGLKKVSDTSLAEAVILNGVIFNAQSVMILSAPATSLAKSLDLQAAKEIYKDRVKMLVIVDSSEPQDSPALRRVLAEFPAPIVFCSKATGDGLPYPGASIERDFAWTEHHPVVDAYTAYKAMPYDAPSSDMAAALYAVRPDSGMFPLSDPGTLSVDDGGKFKFTTGGAGTVRSLVADSAGKDRIIETYIQIASAKPVPPSQRPRPPQVKQ